MSNPIFKGTIYSPEVSAIFNALGFPKTRANARASRVAVSLLRESGAYRLADFWDDGSRTYTYFLELSTFRTVSSEAIPKEARQVMSNPFKLPIADLVIPRGVIVCENRIFCGKPLGWCILCHADDVGERFLGTEVAFALLPQTVLQCS